MKKMVLGAVMAAATLFASTEAFSANVWKNSMEITSIMTLTDGGFIVQGPAGIAPECSGGNSFYVRANQNSQTSDGVKTALALSLTAYSVGKSVNLLFDNTNATCYVQIVQVNP